MKRLALIFSTMFLTTVFGQKNFSGEYITNFPTYGTFGKTLKLNCDSTAVLNFRGDLMNDNSFGRWTIHDKTLTIFFDTLKVNARYKGTLSFKIKGKKLYSVGITKDFYEKLNKAVDEHNNATGEHLEIPTFKEFKKQQSLTPKNFYGKYDRQFFKRSKKYLCSK